jgi:hypothetical protein
MESVLSPQKTRNSFALLRVYRLFNQLYEVTCFRIAATKEIETTGGADTPFEGYPILWHWV